MTTTTRDTEESKHQNTNASNERDFSIEHINIQGLRADEYSSMPIKS
jgi:hypothetical protein